MTRATINVSIPGKSLQSGPGGEGQAYRGRLPRPMPPACPSRSAGARGEPVSVFPPPRPAWQAVPHALMRPVSPGINRRGTGATIPNHRYAQRGRVPIGFRTLWRVALRGTPGHRPRSSRRMHTTLTTCFLHRGSRPRTGARGFLRRVIKV